MNVIASTAALATATAIAPVTLAAEHAQSPDTELIGLSNKILELIPGYVAARDRDDQLWEEYDRRMPQRSPVLLYRLGDPVRYEVGVFDGKEVLFCRSSDIERRRRTRIGYWHFLGTEEQAEQITADDSDEYGDPLPHVRHLYEKVPNKRRQNRFNKILAAYDEHLAARDALSGELGIGQSDDLVCKLSDEIDEMADTVEQTEASTVDGLRAKALVLLRWRWISRRSEDDMYFQGGFCTAILEGLVSMPVPRQAT